MTRTVPLPSRGPIRRFYRRLAQWPQAALGLDYVLVAGFAIGAFDVAALLQARTAEAIASLAVVLLTSVLFAVTIWYREEVVINASIFLAVACVGAAVCGRWVAAIILFPSRGRAVFEGAIGGLFGIPVQVMLGIVVSGLLIAGGRKLRRYFAPDTLEEATPPHDDGGA